MNKLTENKVNETIDNQGKTTRKLKFEYRENYHGMKLIAALCLVWLFVCVLPICATASDRNSATSSDKNSATSSDKTSATSRRENIKVGFFYWDGYHMQDSDGIKDGYGYEFLKMMQSYQNWDYEYVGYDQSWSDMLRLLEEGKIDLVTSAQKTPEWKEKFDYSANPIGTSSTILSMKKGNSDYTPSNPASYDGMRVGMLTGSSRNAKFETFAQEKGFSYERVYFSSLGEMQNALQSGAKVDAILSTNLRTLGNEEVLEELNPVDYYAIVKKGNTELLTQINESIEQMDMQTPGWRQELREKYYSTFDNANLSFTASQQEYLDQLQKDDTTLVVVSNPDLAPYSYMENGEMKGIVPDLFREMAKRMGLKYKFQVINNYNEYNQFVKAGKADIDLTCFADYGLAEYHNVDLTNTYLSTELAYVTKKAEGQSTGKLAEVTGFAYNTTYASQLGDDVKIVKYDNNEACISAVLKGEADGVYMYTYSAQHAVEQDARNRLHYTILPEYSISMAIGVNDKQDYRLIPILNKGIANVKGAYTQQLIQNEVADFTRRSGLVAMFYDYPIFALMIASVVLILIAVTIFAAYHNRERKRRMDAELEHEFQTGKARTEFFMMISHELRTPLNAIVGYLELAVRQLDEEGKESEYIKRSQNAAKQLTSISEDMLDYTKIASGEAKIKEEVFDLKNIIYHVEQNTQIAAEKKEIAFGITIGQLDHEFVVGDRLRVAQIIQNVLSNAVKFNHPGGSVSAVITQLEQEQAQELGREQEQKPEQKSGQVLLQVVVRDTGKGMSEEYIEKICEPFNQSDTSYSRTHGGLGLGLYLTKYYLTAMQGTIRVESELEKGSTFTITIPLQKAKNDQIVEQNIDFSNVRVMIGGVDAQQSSQLKTALKRLQMKCDCITNPDKMLKRIASRVGGGYEYSLCIVDDVFLGNEIDIPSQLSKMMKPPVLFALTGSEETARKWKDHPEIKQVLYQPIFQSVLFDAVINQFGPYRQEKAKEEKPDFHGIHAMVVEDNKINADILRRVLNNANVEVSLFENGRRALEAFERSPYHNFQIIFMDIQMPVMDGYETTRAIRSSGHAGGKEIPIVAVSANAFPEDIEKSMEAGMNDHLSKPINGKKIYEAIGKYVMQESQI